MSFALTFDDGPDPAWTPRLLDALGHAGARATFFPLAPRAAAHPRLIARMRAEGHAIGLHGWAHLNHPDHSREAVAADTDRALGALAGLDVRPRRWRLPWGRAASFTAALADERDLEVVGWTADSEDWRGGGADELLARVEPGLRPGAIVLLHDGLGPGARRGDCAATVALVPRLVAVARARGLEPAALPS